MAKVNQDPFSNGTEYMLWTERNCNRCYKSSHIKAGSDPDNPEYTRITCAIERDIFTRMGSNEPISQRTIDACHNADCPYRQNKRKKYERNKKYPKLF